MATSASALTPAELLARRSTRRTARAHTVRVLDPRTGEVCFETDCGLGAEPQARRVPRCVLTGYALGGRVEVSTSRGWEPRRVILARDGACYLRTLVS